MMKKRKPPYEIKLGNLFSFHIQLFGQFSWDGGKKTLKIKGIRKILEKLVAGYILQYIQLTHQVQGGQGF